MTSRAACRGFRAAAVHRHFRRVHRSARLCVTVIALEKAVFGMTEIAFHDLRRRRDVIPIARLMTAKTFAARKTAAVFRRRMALKTSLVRALRIRNGKIDAAASGFVARRAIGFGVDGVAELDTEASRVCHFLMTAAAVGKIVRAESRFFVVTSRTAICLLRVHRDGDRRHLICSARAVTGRAV